jgi:hypothetical protein
VAAFSWEEVRKKERSISLAVLVAGVLLAVLLEI